MSIEQLARRRGIATEYEDVWGNRRAPSRETLALLLDTLGGDQHLGPVPPAVVLAVGSGAWTVPLSLPAALENETFVWAIDTERGIRSTGSFVPRELPLSERGRELPVGAALGCGYHRFRLEHRGQRLAEALLVVSPARCFRPAALAGDGRIWGPTIQLYAVRSERNWGIGDFTDLRRIVEQWGARGADIVGVSPLHALYPHHPEHASPYAPSSRVFLNVLYIDVEAVAEFAECAEVSALARTPEFQAQLERLRAAPLVDYTAVARVKLEILGRLYASFHDRHVGRRTPRSRAFRSFQHEHGRALRLHAVFEALHESLSGTGPEPRAWWTWPAELRDPASAAVARFAFDHLDRVEFYEYLQWVAADQLALAAGAARTSGLAIGLYLDLAVSIDRAGAESWANQELYAAASIGAPPDLYNTGGQDWGLPPPKPAALERSRYASFIAMLRANMRHAGALRFDHAMGLMRLYWIPAGRAPQDGAYVQYPLDALLGIVALESERNRCVVVGEDLGTVPPELRVALAARGVLSYRLLLFERAADGAFMAPECYPHEALVAATTHDLPTIAGFWEGRDVVLREALGVLGEGSQAAAAQRAVDRRQLVAALDAEGLAPFRSSGDAGWTASAALALNVHRFLARTPSLILVVQLEDLVGATEAANVPGTSEREHPNWRRKLPITLERLAADPRVASVLRMLASERPTQRAVMRLSR
jgi:4-alpha-glucanotransferase